MRCRISGWVKIVVAYIAVSQGVLTADYCARFVGSYLVNPPGIDHQTIVVANGGPLPKETALLFDPLSAAFMPRDNDGGHDLSGYHQVAREVPCDLLVCQGESLHYHRPGWLKKIADAYSNFGEGMYGMFSSYLVRPHLNTTGFAISPNLLLNYPTPTNHDERYAEEHGPNCLWKRVQAAGKAVKLITWDGAWDHFQWRVPRDCLWKGNQSNCLAYCSHTDRFFAADAATKRAWSAWADGQMTSKRLR